LVEHRTRSFPPASIDDIIAHDEALEKYTFLSAQILNRWLRQGSIRSFRGKDGKTVYAKADLSCALDAEMMTHERKSSPGLPDLETWIEEKKKGRPNNADQAQPDDDDQIKKPPAIADIRFADRLLNLREVRAMTKLSSTTIYRMMTAGQFPKSRKLSPQCVRWMESEIEKWIAELPA
jgi:predicted DNA-binding transcriptional regulator AlpA